MGCYTLSLKKIKGIANLTLYVGKKASVKPKVPLKFRRYIFRCTICISQTQSTSVASQWCPKFVIEMHLCNKSIYTTYIP